MNVFSRLHLEMILFQKHPEINSILFVINMHYFYLKKYKNIIPHNTIHNF